jgi:proteasome lid subunit RPN8/RPN11
MIRLEPEQLNRIREIAEQAYPQECCGIMLGSVKNDLRTVMRLVPAQNERSDSPANRYLISPEVIHRLEQEIRGTRTKIVGFFHSHPDVPARPSAYDQEHAWPWFSYLIVAVREGKAQEVLTWRLKDDRSVFLPEDQTFGGNESGD